MSALRQLISFLEAALWLRWRLAAVKARRLFGGRAAIASGGSSYRLAPSQVPVEGVDYDVDELPPELLARLTDTRIELLDHSRSAAARRARRRRTRRRRTVSLVTAALVALTVLGAGAMALVTGSTGVPAVDRWLGIYDAALEKPRKPDRFGPGGRDVRPQPSGAGPSIEVPVGEGSRRVLIASYLSRSGDICSTVTDVDRDDERGNVSCLTSAFLSARLQREDGLVSGGVSTTEARLLVGFVTASVDRISARGPTKSLDVHVGSSWEPDVVGVGSLRPFVVVEPLRPAVVNPRDYVIRVQIGKNRPTEIRP
jgi:hypothetical protein